MNIYIHKIPLLAVSLVMMLTGMVLIGALLALSGMISADVVLPMTELAAISLFFSSLSLGTYLYHREKKLSQSPSISLLLVRALASTVITIGIWTLLVHHLNNGFFDLTIWEAAFYPIEDSTALNLILLGSSLFALTRRQFLSQWTAQILAVVTIALAVVDLISYLYGFPLPVLIRPDLKQPVVTALSFVIICLGILFVQPHQALMGRIMAPTSGGHLIRQLLPWIITIPILVGWLFVSMEAIDILDHDQSQAMQSIITVVSLLGLVWTEARRLNLLEQERQSFYRAYTEIDQCFRSSIILLPFPVALFTKEGHVWLLNRAWQQETGYNLTQIGTWQDWLLAAFPKPSDQQLANQEFQRTLTSGERVEQGDVTIRTNWGEQRIWSMSSIPLELATSKQQLILITAVDVTEYRQVAAELALGKENLERQVMARTEDLLGVNDELQKSEEKLNQILDGANAFFSQIRLYSNGKWQYEYLSEGHERLLGYSGFDFKEDQSLWRSRVPNHDWEIYYKPFQQRLYRYNSAQVEYRFRHRNGQLRWLAISATKQWIDADRSQLITYIGVDITERKEAQLALEESEARFRQMADSSPMMIWLTNSIGQISFANQTLLNLIDHPTDLAQGWLEAIHPEDRLEIERDFSQATATQQLFDVEYRIRGQDGSYRWVLDRGVPRYDHDGEYIGHIGSCMDISDRKLAEAKLQQAAWQDSLTGLPNRNFLIERLEALLEAYAADDQQRFAILFLDLDRFKVVNDSLGHAAGDRFLVEIAQRLQICLRQEDTLARLGGDEFVIVVENIVDAQDAFNCAERVQAAINKSYVLDHTEVTVGVSIGITLVGPEYHTAGEMLRDADIAMYEAKANGRSEIQLFRPEQYRRAHSLLHREQEFRRALREQQLQVFYQPIVDLRTDTLLGFEALIRWNHPTLGLVSPGNFLPIAEQLGLMREVDRWCMMTAAQQLAQWQDTLGSKVSGLRMSVNLSSQMFGSLSLVEDVTHTLRTTQLSGDRLILEITEGVIMEQPDIALKKLIALEKMGISCSVDDFGTGYSSLSRLSFFPLYALKIDQSFVRSMENSPENLEIIRAIIKLSEAINLKVIAEGIETHSQKLTLLQMGCQRGQGYLFSQPIDAQGATELIRKNLSFS
ncbi:EAL domain-containing protein [Candidatus Synechococcus calcipolaris G9]|uniref:EAL domain-containing protein n=1 Tax=Candidatus Synechococcus calcipolaris G9 TaxID=1497997 RepID=A0ABT6F1R6_9SYNE|nr:EAL domain-containing protein [Candidatus Synechococcus calcipolaris]MDG2991796.1 EAL domain-containing protein [Candidatus Synechococcus calcipolaris G9]